MTRRHWFLFSLLAALAAASPARAADDDAVKDDLAALKAANLDTDSKSLVAYIKKRTISEELRGKIADAIKNLSADEFEDREKAYKALVDIGGPARPQLREALKDSELETRRRARRALDKIGPPSAEAAVFPAAARVLASRKEADTAELILNFLPSIEEVDTAEEVARSLSAVALDKNRKPEAAVLKALADKYPIKRWAAAAALTQAGGKNQRDAVIKLLADADPGVRRRVAAALVQDAKDSAGIPALIKLLDSDSPEDAGYAEDLLATVAGGDKAPAPPADSDSPKARENYKKKWEDWWEENKKLDLKKVDFDGVGSSYTLVGLYGYARRVLGKIVEVDNNGKEKWTIDELSYPVYACKVRRDRVLVCEYNGNKVTERDTKTGKPQWTKQLNTQPLFCERLSNGNTFIVTRNQLIEVDRNGKETKTILNRPGYDIATGGRHKDGSYTAIMNNGMVLRMDSSGKQTKEYSLGGYLSYTVGLKCHYLPRGGIVIPEYSYSRIREFDGNGKEVHKVSASYPTAVTKLGNGNYVYLARTNNTIAEVTRDGKAVGNSKSIPGIVQNNVRMNVLFMERK